MKRKHQAPPVSEAAEAPPAPADPAPDALDAAHAEGAVVDEVAEVMAEAAALALGATAAVPAEPDAEAIRRLEGQVSEWQDRALRAAADLENYRRRVIREREDALTRSQGEVLLRMIEVVDDLARVAHLDPAQTAAEALHEGMLAIERKFQRSLEASGVERIDPAGVRFDPNSHEAVTMMPAPSEETDGTVGMVFQAGYRFRGTLLRPARVAVLRWTPPPDGAASLAN